MPKKKKHPNHGRACYPLEMYATTYQALKAICAHDGRSIKDGLTIAIEDYISKRAMMVANSLTNTSARIRDREFETEE